MLKHIIKGGGWDEERQRGGRERGVRIRSHGIIRDDTNENTMRRMTLVAIVMHHEDEEVRTTCMQGCP